MSEDGVSPLTITIMLACYVSPDPEAHVGSCAWSSTPGKAAHAWLVTHGLIENNRATPKGMAWVKHICATPLPVQAWLRPNDLALANRSRP